MFWLLAFGLLYLAIAEDGLPFPGFRLWLRAKRGKGESAPLVEFMPPPDSAYEFGWDE